MVSNFLNELYIFVQNIIIKERFVSFYYKVMLKNYSLIFNPYHIIYVSRIYNIFFVYLFDNVKMKILRRNFAICDATGWKMLQ